MPSTAELYNQEVLEGHREALAALRELLAQEKDPAERRKLANAILRARRVKTDPPALSVPTATTARAKRRKPTAQQPAPHTNDIADHDDLDLDDGDWDQDDAAADETIRRITADPDRAAALRELQAMMRTSLNALGSSSNTPKDPET